MNTRLMSTVQEARNTAGMRQQKCSQSRCAGRACGRSEATGSEHAQAHALFKSSVSCAVRRQSLSGSGGKVPLHCWRRSRC
eukprot:4183804-Pleurochrysis_carterae.AAC.1